MPREHGAQHVWTWAGVLALLAGGAIGGQCLTRARPATRIALESIAVAGWEQVGNNDLRDPEKGRPEAKQVEQLYKDQRGRVVRVSLKATYTRLGALRDYSLARIADGWGVEHSAQLALDGVEWGEAPLRVTRQRLRKARSVQVALSWYCSPDEVRTGLRAAALSGWRGRLLGKQKPWAQVYVVTDVEGDAVAEAEATLKDVATSIAPQLRDVLVAAAG